MAREIPAKQGMEVHAITIVEITSHHSWAFAAVFAEIIVGADWLTERPQSQRNDTDQRTFHRFNPKSQVLRRCLRLVGIVVEVSFRHGLDLFLNGADHLFPNVYAMPAPSRRRLCPASAR